MTEDLWTDEQTDDLDRLPSSRQRTGHTDGDRHIGCPLWWFKLVFPIVRGKNELAVALYIIHLPVTHNPPQSHCCDLQHWAAHRVSD